ncbi:hypothetical protein Jiend_01090 [Micromonospora endophytica]|nr:hypothetical protein Jiend_01090 [Micromonospora endophytica]
MIRMRRIATLTCVAIGLALTWAAPARADADCAWSDLPLPTGARWATVHASDGHGSYVGTDDLGNAIRWQGSTVEVLGAGITARDVNAGVVVGDKATGLFSRGPGRWVSGAWEPLPVPAGTSGTATDVSANGDILGTLNYGRLIRWPAAAPGTYELLTGPFAGYAEPTGIAADGTIIAWAVIDSTRPHAGLVRHPDGTWTTLASPSSFTNVFPRAISGDTIVGSSGPDLLEWNATDGDLVRVVPDASAVDVNSAGQVLGTGDGTTVWQDGTVITVLPTVSGRTVEPIAIDEDGTVVGQLPWGDDFDDLPRPMTAHCD